jgi:vancomycin resistance protein YoaR
LKSNKNLIFIIVLITLPVIAIFGGLLIMGNRDIDTVPYGTYIGENNLSGMQVEKAEDIINNYCEEAYNNGIYSIYYMEKDSNEPYDKLPLNLIATGYEYKEQLNSILQKKSMLETLDRVMGITTAKRYEIIPVLLYSDEFIETLAQKISDDKSLEALNATIDIVDDELKKTKDITGIKINTDKIAENIKSNNKLETEKNYILSVKNNDIEEIKPETTLDDFKDFTKILGSSQIYIKSDELEQKVEGIRKAFNYLEIKSVNEDPDSMFSFKEVLRDNNILFKKGSEHLNIISSALYQAFLTSGIELKSIHRTKGNVLYEYILPGGDAIIDQNNDLELINDLTKTILVINKIEYGSLNFYIIGSKNDDKYDYRLDYEILKKFEAPVVYVENKNLPDKKSIIQSPGRVGLEINLYRFIMVGDEILRKEFISNDLYSPENKVIEVYKDIEWDFNIVK